MGVCEFDQCSGSEPVLCHGLNKITGDSLVDSDEVTRIGIAGLSAASGIDLIER